MSQPLTRVLVVDDEPALCDMMRQLLTRWGYAVECATAAGEAVAILAMKSCDLALIDYLMPGVNGIELAQNLKRVSPTMPVVMISAFPPAQVPGVDRIYAKPLTAEELKRIVENSLILDTPFEVLRRKQDVGATPV